MLHKRGRDRLGGRRIGRGIHRRKNEDLFLRDIFPGGSARRGLVRGRLDGCRRRLRRAGRSGQNSGERQREARSRQNSGEGSAPPCIPRGGGLQAEAQIAIIPDQHSENRLTHLASRLTCNFRCRSRVGQRKFRLRSRRLHAWLRGIPLRSGGQRPGFEVERFVRWFRRICGPRLPRYLPQRRVWT